MERILSFTIPTEDYELPTDNSKTKFTDQERELMRNM
jgi:hypothetical protein